MLGILQQQLDLVSLEQVAVHAGVVVVSPGALLHEQVQLDGRVAFVPVDVVFKQDHHHGIDTIPVGLSAVVAVAAEEEQVPQLRRVEDLFPQCADDGPVGRGGTVGDARYILEDGTDAFFVGGGYLERGWCLYIQAFLKECFPEGVDVKVLDQDQFIFLFHCPKNFLGHKIGDA